MVIPSREYLQGLSRLCQAKGALLILDEVQASLGRSGKLWAFEHYDILPDILVVGKGLSGGLYPITATILRKPLESVFHPDPFIHISTFGGSEPGCRVAGRVLELSADPAFLAHVNALAEAFAGGMQELLEKHHGILLGFRQLGLLMGLVLADELCGPLLTRAAWDSGLLLIWANNDPSVAQLLPPLVMKLEEVDLVLGRLDRALAAVRRTKPLYELKRGAERLLGCRGKDSNDRRAAGPPGGTVHRPGAAAPREFRSPPDPQPGPPGLRAAGPRTGAGQRPELVPEAVRIVNRNLSAEPLSVEEVKRYYRGDKLLWSVFLSFRKIDRWLKTRMFGKRYEFILPAKIER